MTTYTRDDIHKHVSHAVRDNATIIYWHQAMESVAYLKAEDNHLWKNELKSFRGQFKKNELSSITHNNKKKETKEYGTWYQLIIQTSNMDICPRSPLPMLAFGEIVYGLCYYFKNERDRDNAFKYLTK